MTVPDRLTLTLPATMKVTLPTDRLQLTSTLATGFMPQSVEYFANQTSLGAVSVAPFAVAAIMTKVPSGHYTFTAVATDSQGDQFTSPAVAADFVNIPSDKAIAAAKAKAPVKKPVKKKVHHT